MAYKLEIRIAELEDAYPVADRLRQSDMTELAAQHGLGLTNREAVLRSLMVSDIAWTVLCDGVPVCVFGVSSSPSLRILGAGSPWMLAGETFDRLPVGYVVRESRKHAKIMLEKYHYLYNFVYYKNYGSIRWLKSMGFKVHENDPLERGEYGGKFYAFDRARGGIR